MDARHEITVETAVLPDPRFFARIAFPVLLILLSSVSNVSYSAQRLSTTGVANAQTSTPQSAALIRNRDDSINTGPVEVPPGDTDPDPEQCYTDGVYSVDNTLLSGLSLLLSGTRMQISHTGQGIPLVAEPRTVNFTKSITAAKFEQLESAQEERCNKKPNPAQCMADWYQRMNETVVHTYQSEFHSYIDWSDAVTNATGLDYTPLPIPVVEKSVQKKLTKALTSALILPIAVNVDRARCYVNQIESIVYFNNNTHPAEIRNGKLEVGMPLDSVGYPTLKCEGRAVALWGLHTWGWADELFPDVSLTNMQIHASIGAFRSEDDLPMYSSVDINVQADIDLNNIPSVGEDLIDFIKDYSDKSRTRVAEVLHKKLMSDAVREAFGRGIVQLVEQRTGDEIERVCKVNAEGDRISIEYEEVLPPYAVRHFPGLPQVIK